MQARAARKVKSLPLLELVLLGVDQAHSDVLVHEEQHGGHQGREECRPASPHGEGHEGHQPRAADGGGQRRGHGKRGESKGVPVGV